MNFTQTQDRLRQELFRRMQRGILSVSLLGRQTGISQVHLSNFVHGKRQLSLDALDRVLASQRLTVSDLLPALHRFAALGADEGSGAVPIVSHAAAIFEPHIKAAPRQEMMRIPGAFLESLRARAPSQRRSWQRFVAIRVQAADALAMEPLVLAEAVALVDRHYTSLSSYSPKRPSLYAVKQEAHLVLRYVEFRADRLVLRPHNIAFPLDLIEVDPGNSPGELLAGRVALILNEP